MESKKPPIFEDDPDAPPSEEELAASARLRDALEDPRKAEAATAFLAIARVLGACQGKQAQPVCAGADAAATPIDNEVMAYLSAARARHHEANIREDEGDLVAAVVALEKLVAMKTPHPGTRVV